MSSLDILKVKYTLTQIYTHTHTWICYINSGVVFLYEMMTWNLHEGVTFLYKDSWSKFKFLVLIFYILQLPKATSGRQTQVPPPLKLIILNSYCFYWGQAHLLFDALITVCRMPIKIMDTKYMLVQLSIAIVY